MRLTKLESEAGMARNIVDGLIADLLQLDGLLPASKRGSRVQKCLDSLSQRAAAAKQCLDDGISSLNPGDHK